MKKAGRFLKRWLANSLKMGSVIPSSPALCRHIAAFIRRGPEEVAAEIGTGTGMIGHALLAAGVPPERLVVVEIVRDMAEHLRRVLPGVTVIDGDAFDLPKRLHGKVGTVICGIPRVMLPIA